MKGNDLPAAKGPSGGFSYSLRHSSTVYGVDDEHQTEM